MLLIEDASIPDWQIPAPAFISSPSVARAAHSRTRTIFLNKTRSKNPSEGITLEALLTELLDYYGWDYLGQQVPIRCFQSNPSIKSSLTFLRRTPWARNKVEQLFKEFKLESSR